MTESGKIPMSVSSVVDMLLEQGADPIQVDFGESPGEEAAQAADAIIKFIEDDSDANVFWNFRADLEQAIENIDDLDVSGLTLAGIQTQWRDADALFDQAVKTYKKLAERLRGLRSGTA